MENIFGIGASTGITIAEGHYLTKTEIVIPNEKINEDDIWAELEKFKKAKQETQAQISIIIENVKIKMSEKESMIFEAHLEMSDDPMLADTVEQKVKVEHKNILLAINETKNELAKIFEDMDNEYFKERAADVRDVCGRILNNVLGIKSNPLENIDKEVIIITDDLTPSDTAMMDFNFVKGFITSLGGRTSHSSIMARSLEIPAVVGIGDKIKVLQNTGIIIIDGKEGKIITNPDAQTLEQYKQKQELFIKEKKLLELIKDLPAQTKDGKAIELCGNIGSVSDLTNVIKNGAEGIGLFRTEFLYMNGDSFPSEDVQFESYKEVAKQMKDFPVIIRTLDIGGDKELSYFDFGKEMNPFLGYRALRICLDKTDIFKTQLRAILRASAFGNIKIMYPMIISLEELRKSKEILEQCKQELKQENIDFDEQIQQGIMIETPAASIMAPHFAKEVDFFSIGTNDLTQYTLAVDRGNEKVSALYNSFHPAVLRSIKTIIDAAHDGGIWCGMCGEMAGEEKATLLLLGMGLDEFSAGAGSLPLVKKIIRDTNNSDAVKIANDILQLATVTEIEDYLKKLS